LPKLTAVIGITLFETCLVSKGFWDFDFLPLIAASYSRQEFSPIYCKRWLGWFPKREITERKVKNGGTQEP
jgi:hypothetical protein